jgi:zinc transport system permease protein
MLDRIVHPFEFFSAFYLATVLVAAGCAYLGVYVAVKRVVFIGVALAEMSAAGIAAALLVAFVFLPGLGEREADYLALGGSVLFSLAGVAVLAVPFAEKRVSREGVVAVTYAVGAAAAILLVWKSAQDLDQVKNILAGSSLYVSDTQLATLAVAFLALGAVHAALRKEFIFCSFDPTTARTLGLPARAIDLTLYVTIGLAIALALRTLGVLPVFAFLSVPAVEGLLLARRFGTAFLHAVGQALVASAAGLIAADFLDLPPGPATVALLVLLLVPAGIASRVAWFRKVWVVIEATGAVLAIVLAVVAARAYVEERDKRLAHTPPHRVEAPAHEVVERGHEASGSHEAEVSVATRLLEEGDEKGIEMLVNVLATDAPPFERGEALERLQPINEGETFGYDSDRDATANAAAISAWRDWYAHHRGRFGFDRAKKTWKTE